MYCIRRKSVATNEPNLAQKRSFTRKGRTKIDKLEILRAGLSQKGLTLIGNLFVACFHKIRKTHFSSYWEFMVITPFMFNQGGRETENVVVGVG